MLINFSIKKMKNMKSLLLFCFLFNMINLYKLEEEKYYFQLYPPDDKTQPNLFHFYDWKSIFYTWNSTEGDDIQEISYFVKNNETPISKLSSVLSDGDIIIKTCFGPNKILEVIDEQKESLSPKDNYFTVKNNLENIEYCYSTAIANPYRPSEFIIVTYWTEKTQIKGNVKYEHRSILFYPKTKTFSKIDLLDTKDKSFFAQSCTNIRNKYIYCNINKSSSQLFQNYHFSIIPSFINANEIQMLIKLVKVFYTFNEANYYRPIGINKYLYTKNGKYAYYFLTEMHDKQNNKTKLMTSYYYNSDLRSFININVDDESYNGINLEDIYIDPNLFNYLLPNNEEMIIIYTMMGPEGKNLLLLNRYNYTNDLRKKTKFDKYSSSNYLRDDICERPKYMQSMYINSFIKYDERDQEYIRNHPNQTFYTYQRDIATVISCDDGSGNVFYQTKKIQMPQCFNVLNEINGVNTSFIFTMDNGTVNLDFNNPNYKSLRNVEIEFFDSILYKNFLMVQPVKNGERDFIEKAEKIKLSDYERLEFTRSVYFRKGQTIKLPYRIIQTEKRDNSISCHLSSDICQFEFHYQGEDVDCPFCTLIGDNTCIQCKNITGIKKIDNACGCECDEKKGFNKVPNIYIDMCICKEGFSFYKNINQCLPNTKLNNGSFCILRQDEKSLINIYDDLIGDRAICYEGDLPKCCKEGHDDVCQQTKWFELGNYIFYSTKIGQCVFITFNNSIVMYSSRSDCEYIDIDIFNQCPEIHIKNKKDYLDNAYEYNLEDNNNSLIIKINNSNKETNTTFYLLNNFTKINSSVTLSAGCIEKIKEEKKLQDLLIFIATIKKKGSISTQVEYSFYNPIPGLIDEQINISSICYNSKNPNNNLNKRGLKVAQEWTNNGNYTTEIDEVIINVEIDWTSKHKKNIDYLTEKNINIFDSDDSFYNDVCFKFTTENETDIYLQERRDYYFIKDGLCESGCKQVGFDANTSRIICKCNIKSSTEGYENVTFSPNKGFEKDYLSPNVKVLKCIGKIKFSLGFLLSFILLIVFIIISFCNCNMCYCCKKKAPSFIIKKKDNRVYYVWEEPIEELKDKLQEFEDKYKKDHNINNENGDEGNQGAVNQDDDPEIELFRKPVKKDDNPEIEPLINPSEENTDNIQKHKRNIHNDPKQSSNKVKLHLIDQSETSSQKINNKTNTNPTENSEINSVANTENISDKISDINLIDVKKKEEKKEEEEEEKKEEEEEEKKEEEKDEEEKKEEEKKLDEKEKEEKEEEKKEMQKLAELYSDKQSEISSKSGGSKTLPLKDYSYSRDSNYTSFTQKSKKEINSEKKHIHKKNSKSKKKEPKANPPSKELGYDRPGSKSKEPFSKKGNKEKKSKKNSEDKNIKRICLPINYKDCIYTAIKHPEIISIPGRWYSKMVSENTVIFSLPSLFCLKDDKNGYFIKLSVLIISISFYITAIIFFQINTSTLHLFLEPDEKFGAYLPGWFLNIIPNILVYFLTHFFKDSLSLREFYWEEIERIDYINGKLDDDEYKFNEWEIKKKNEITRIKKFRNNLENNIRLTVIFGLIILLIDMYYISIFFSVYENSFWCVVVNLLMSILIHIGFFAIVHLISSLCNFNLAKYLFKFSEFCCSGFYLIFLSWKLCNEEFQKSEEHDEIEIEIAEGYGINNEQNNENERSGNRNIPPPNNEIVINQVYNYQNL